MTEFFRRELLYVSKPGLTLMAAPLLLCQRMAGPWLLHQRVCKQRNIHLKIFRSSGNEDEADLRQRTFRTHIRTHARKHARTHTSLRTDDLS